EGFTYTLKGMNSLHRKKLQETAVHFADSIEEGRLFGLGKIQKPIQIVDDVEKREDKSPQRFPAEMSTLPIGTPAIIIEICQRPKVEVVLGFQFLF
ncbi:MAG TPA: hypothetical protein VER98_13440, partial [Terriglobia bacterium]|nr:hypothetical protein [Terriglobia bacterium]